MADDGKTRIEATPGGREIVITRTFDAPRERVFRAYTDPEQLVKWLGPKRLTMRIEKHEARAGGSWRFIHSDSDGEYGFHGVYHAVNEPAGVVRTFEYEGTPGQVSLDTLILEDDDGKTKLTSISVFQTPEARDGMLEAGMEKGVNEGFESLDELLGES